MNFGKEIKELDKFVDSISMKVNDRTITKKNYKDDLNFDYFGVIISKFKI